MKLIFVLTFIFWSSVSAQVTQSVSSKALPLLEFGIGAVAADVPDYPGAGHNTTHTVPFPAGIYRGDVLRADEDGGARARFLNTELLEINMSVGGSLPADSEENPDRVGMPDLDTMLEVGPGLIVHLIKPSPTSKIKLSLNIPVRFAFSTDLKNWDDRGFIFNPLLYYIHEDVPFKKMIFFFGLDTSFATKRMMDYFYTVAPQYSTTARSTYYAKGGYLGTGTNIGFAYSFKNEVSLFGGLRQSFYSGASNLESPLLVSRNNTSIGIGVVWWFWKSKTIGYK